MKKYLYDISPSAWEHPADRAALAALKQLSGIDELIRLLVGKTTEKSLRMIALASSVRVSGLQFPGVRKKVEEACYVLDVKEVPEVYISQNPLMNAGSVGVEKPFITINSALIEQLAEEELQAVIGHELGHIASGHVLYKTLLWLLMNISTNLVHIPLGNFALGAIIAALREWDRKSELSADRAGLLVLQDPSPAYTVLMKLAGGSRIGEMVLEDFFNQAYEYEKGGDILDSVHKLLNMIGQRHPFHVVRLKELKEWVDSGKYEKILSGEYRKRGDREEDIQEEFRQAADQYREDFDKSGDPLASALSKIGKQIDAVTREAGKQAEEFFKGLFG